jgi:hypothetical protein
VLKVVGYKTENAFWLTGGWVGWWVCTYMYTEIYICIRHNRERERERERESARASERASGPHTLLHTHRIIQTPDDPNMWYQLGSFYRNHDMVWEACMYPPPHMTCGTS